MTPSGDYSKHADGLYLECPYDRGFQHLLVRVKDGQPVEVAQICENAGLRLQRRGILDWREARAPGEPWLDDIEHEAASLRFRLSGKVLRMLGRV